MLNVTHVQISFLFKLVNISYFRLMKGIRPSIVIHGSVTSIYCFELGVNIVNIVVSNFHYAILVVQLIVFQFISFFGLSILIVKNQMFGFENIYF